MQSVLVRGARATDLDALLSLYRELADPRGSAAPADREGSAPVLERILAEPDRQLLLATVEDEVVGTADLLVVSNLTHHAQPWAIVENVVVAGGHRGRGVGRTLMEHMIESARSAGCYKLQLLSGKDRVDAHRLYRRLGLDSVAEGFKIYL
jgi:GNAT superfamily N-acetyltransferase